MRQRLRAHRWAVLIGALEFFAAAPAYATDYYVAPDGNDANAGTIDQPFASLQHAQDAVSAGDTVYIRGGTYNIVTPATNGAGILISKSGTSDTNRINFWAYEGEKPIFDFSGMTISTSGYTHGFVVTGSWLHFRGLDIRNVPMNTSSNNGMAVNGGGHDIFELMDFHDNNGTGLFIGDGDGGHLVLNCDSHDNYDPTSSQGDGQNADGFGLHYQTSGDVSTFSGCRAWWNSDDGYDFINQEVSGVIENSWAMANGYIDSGTARPADGNGNGFKVGSSKTGVRHTVTNCVAWGNAATGFYANHSSGGNDWFNNTSYRNGTQYNMLASDPNDSSVKIILSGSLVHVMRNNIGFPDKNTNMEGVDTGFNSWDLGLVPADGDFLSVDDTGAMGPRQADGSLPDLDFMKLAEGSQMIDVGTDVSLPYVGAAPDLGAYEYGASPTGTTTTTTGSGGTGTGGTAAVGTTDATGTTGSTGTTGAGATTGAGGTGAATTTSGAVGAGGTTSAVGTTTGASGMGGTVASTATTAGGTGDFSASGTTVGSVGDTSPKSSSGCACRVGSSPSTPAPFGALVSLLGVAWVTRRRAKRAWVATTC